MHFMHGVHKSGLLLPGPAPQAGSAGFCLPGGETDGASRIVAITEYILLSLVRFFCDLYSRLYYPPEFRGAKRLLQSPNSPFRSGNRGFTEVRI